jgi:hypothetical protein
MVKSKIETLLQSNFDSETTQYHVNAEYFIFNFSFFVFLFYSQAYEIVTNIMVFDYQIVIFLCCIDN